MAMNTSVFMHDSDKAALQALKAIPGFTQLLKGFMSIWNERQFQLLNMSSRLRLSEKQMSKYYDMLPPICEKLGIGIPDLYIELDVSPNSYTSGDTKPFIVMTSGLLETLPDELIPTVLAHECGHIACHHVLYSTMGRMIMKGVLGLSGFSALVTTPLQIAFAYWMRCSEFSADRAAVLYDGTPNKMVEVCMRLAGYDKDIVADASVAAFMEQAKDYKELVANSTWDKTLEFLMFSQYDHPLTALRAYECNEWSDTEQFKKIQLYLNENHFVNDSSPASREIPVRESSKFYIGKDYNEVKSVFESDGFISVKAVKTAEKGLFTKSGQVISVSIDESNSFEKDSWHRSDSEVIITYYEPLSTEELVTLHSGRIQTPDSAKKCIGRSYQDVVQEFSDAGFTQIVIEKQNVKKGLLTKDLAISKITVKGQLQFSKGDWFEPDSLVRIIYQNIITE